jgi:benzoate-CoA ligase
MMSRRFNVAHELLCRNLVERSHRTVLFHNEASLTYAAAAGQASRFGHLLLSFGVRPRERIVLELPDQPECVCAFLGSIQAGIWPVLINPDLGQNTREFILQDVQAIGS